MDLSTRVYNYLKTLFQNPECELKFSTNFELLVSVILSAQCTDKRVNECTEKLFKIANKPEHFAQMKQEELEKHIYSCGFYKNKAKSIISMSKMLISNFNGEVPSTLEDLQKLSGVGKKTANVVYSTAFNGDAIAVDTHVFRVSNRIGLANANNVKKTEEQLMKNIKKQLWSEYHYLLVLFGRYYCTARKPKCEQCNLKDVCKYYKKEKQNVCW